MIIAGYRLDLAALLARVCYRWRTPLLLLLLLPLALLLVRIVPPFWRGSALLSVRAVPGATISVDGQPWSADQLSLAVGAHRVVASGADGRRAAVDIYLRVGVPLTVTLPAGLRVRARPLAAAAPGAQIADVWRADDGWRITSVSVPPETVPAGWQPITRTLVLGPRGIQRAATIDAYAGLADTATGASGVVEAVFRAGRGRTGVVEVRGWGATPVVIALDAPPTLLRLAPGGGALLIASATSAGEQVELIDRSTRRVPLVALPGRVRRVAWHPAGNALLLTSVAGERLTLTLARLDSSPVAAVITEQAAIPAALLPYIWERDGLRWIAADATGAPMLYRAALADLLPEARGLLAAYGLTLNANQAQREIRIIDEIVVIGQQIGGLFVVEAELPDIPPTADLVAEFAAGQAIVRAAGQTWLLEIEE